jgi:LysR family nitrogen assimilation transcriptional regulator
MDLRQLKYFVAIADAGSFTGAAAVLHIAQSALSRHMGLLEASLGGALFERNARGISLTDGGTALLKSARFILAQIEDSRAEVMALNGEVRGTVRLAMPSSLSQLFYVPLVNHFLDLYPGVALQLSEGTTQNVLGRLRDGTIDVGVVTQPPPDSHLEFSFFAKEPLVLMGPAGDPLLRRKSLAPQALRSLPLMMATGVLALLGTLARELTPVVLVDSTLPIKSLILAGRGYAVVPASSSRVDVHLGKIASVPLRGLHMTRMLATHRGRPVSRASREVIAYLHAEAPALTKVA